MATVDPKENEDTLTKQQEDIIKDALNHVKNYTPRLGVFGDTGAGKSHLCNALFGTDIAFVSDVEAGTKDVQEILLQSSGKGGLVLIDFPGLSEDPERHGEYIELYESNVPRLDLLLWVIKADDRKFSSGIDFYNRIKGKVDVIFVINQIDKIEPIEEFYSNGMNLGETQKNNIKRKIQDILSKFGAQRDQIIPISAKHKIGLKDLVTRAIQILPNEKKFSFSRESNDEFHSEESREEVERGILEFIKEKLNEAADKVVEAVQVIWDRVKPTWFPW